MRREINVFCNFCEKNIKHEIAIKTLRFLFVSDFVLCWSKHGSSSRIVSCRLLYNRA
jgi:hypothetical protein